MKLEAFVATLALGALAACGARAKSDATDEHAQHSAAAAPAPAPHTAHASVAADGDMPEGYAAVAVDPARAAALGLTTAVVEERDFAKQLRTTGVVALDETRSAHVHPKVRGWIDGITVNFVGKRVAAGQALCSIYSQEVFAAENEFLSVLERTSRDATSRTAPTGEFAEAERGAQAQLLEAARRRLSLWDVPEGEIDRLASTREARRTFPLLAPRGGVVVSKQAIEGMFVDPSTELYTLSDLSHVWVLADVYETDTPFVRIGSAAQLDVEGRAAPTKATLAFIPPTVDQATRTLKVRFELDNRDGSFRPGAFVTATMNLEMGRGLAVPESAVIRTGARAIVFVAHGEHAEHLMPREITLGPLIGDAYRIEAGLEAGDKVATGAQFLIDSESRLRASSASSPSGGGHAGHVH